METTTSFSVKRKRRLEDAFIVISDSDGEEPKEENGLQKMKTKQSNRAKCLAKRKIAQMTEEEQFALALKMSEQEAREVNSQEEEEEELLRKAIAESLNSCRPSDASATRSRPLATGPSSQSHQEKTTDSGITEGGWFLQLPGLFSPRTLQHFCPPFLEGFRCFPKVLDERSSSVGRFWALWRGFCNFSLGTVVEPRPLWIIIAT